MVFNLADLLSDRKLLGRKNRRKRLGGSYIAGCTQLSSYRQENAAVVPRNRRLPLMGMLAAMLVVTVGNEASTQTVAALVEPQTQILAPAKPMTPERAVWLKKRCSQLVAFFDYYGVSRGENSDGPRNHTRIGAAIECERTRYHTGIGTMAALLKRKAFDVPKPGTPAVEPEDIEAPDIGF